MGHDAASDVLRGQKEEELVQEKMILRGSGKRKCERGGGEGQGGEAARSVC